MALFVFITLISDPALDEKGSGVDRHVSMVSARVDRKTKKYGCVRSVDFPLSSNGHQQSSRQPKT
jgi:hypothetical protein